MTQDRLTLLSGYNCKNMKLGGRKHPDHMGDAYKHLSVNMAAGSRLSRCNHGFLLIPASFPNMFFRQNL